MRITILIILLAFIAACASPRPYQKKGYARSYKALGKWYQPLRNSANFSQKGIASWYGNKFHGKKTASGEIYNMYAMTAAHKTLPLNTWVKVKRIDTKKEVIVKINDRGPFVSGRIIDLSYKAAKKLGITSTGTAKVIITAINKQHKKKQKNLFTYSVQIGAFGNKANAEKFRAKLSRKYSKINFYITNDSQSGVYKVKAGKYSSRNKAVLTLKNLVNDKYKSSFIIEE